MRRFIVTISWLASLTLLLTACSTATPVPTATVTPQPVQTSPQAGDKAPDFTLTDNEGNSVQLSVVAAEHKSTVLVFYLSYT
jgi:uncharacterized protein YcfL